ncbi:MAG: carbon-nitrogen hydrolase family protein [Candidatus Saccharimonadales bacterium]
MKFKIAVVQFDSQIHEPKQNLIKAERFIKEASEKGAGVIIFPEDFITAPIWNKLDLIDRNFTYRDMFIRFAKEYKIDIITGSFLEENKTGDYNTSYYIDFKGRVKARYQKNNLWLTERNYITSGNEVSVFNTRFGKAGIVICWDLAFPEMFRRMVSKGVKIVYCPSWWGYKDTKIALKYDLNAEPKFVKALCQARAMENGIILVYCNSAGEITVDNYHNELLGCSQVAVPFKGVQKILDHNKEEMFIEEVDTQIVKDHEKGYKIKRDLKNRF